MAQKYNFNLDQGADFNTEIRLLSNNAPFDLTNCVVASSMKKNQTSLTSYQFSCTVQDAANGVLQLGMPSSASIDIDAGRFLYDIEVTDSQGKVHRVLEGIVTVTPSITRSA